MTYKFNQNNIFQGVLNILTSENIYAIIESKEKVFAYLTQLEEMLNNEFPVYDSENEEYNSLLMMDFPLGILKIMSPRLSYETIEDLEIDIPVGNLMKEQLIVS